jgi:hypothetical protein
MSNHMQAVLTSDLDDQCQSMEDDAGYEPAFVTGVAESTTGAF